MPPSLRHEIRNHFHQKILTEQWLQRFSSIVAAFLCLLILLRPVPAQADLLSINFESSQMEYENGSREIRMKGDARIFGKEAGIHADSLRIRFHSEKMEEAFSEQNIESLEAEGQVRLHYKDFSTSSEKARYESKGQKLLLEGNPAVFMNPDIKITGNKIFYEHSLENMQVEGSDKLPSTLQYTLQGSPPTAVMSQSLYQHWDNPAQTLTLKKKVHIQHTDMDLKADSVIIHYRGKASLIQNQNNEESPMSIHTLIAEGDVQITHPNGRAWGERAIFVAADDTITLTGSPARLERQGHVLQGPAIRMNRKSGEVEFSGGVSGTLLQEKGTSPSMPF